jgi:uncharacterized protein YbcI
MAEAATQADRQRPEGGELRAALSRAMVRIHSEHYGRGPRKAKTFINGNVITCVLEDGFTQVEKTLNTAGLHEHVRRTRHLFQTAVKESFTGAVEELTGRRVAAFISQAHSDPDLSVEVFLLEPQEGDTVLADAARSDV